MEKETRRERRLRYQLAFTLIATLLLIIIVTLPFTLASVVNDVLGPPEGERYPIPAGTPPPPAPTHSRLNVAVVALDETQSVVTLRVAGHHVCDATCDWADRLMFFSVPVDKPDLESLPPGASVNLPANSGDVTQTIQLPMEGQPLRYPFDWYALRLGIVMQRDYGDNRVETVTTSDARGHLFLTIQEQLARQNMAPPVAVDPASVRVETAPYDYLYVYDLRFQRPVYLQVLAVLLTLLVTAAAAYAVFLRPLSELVVNSGALVLGVWGIRQILVPGNYYYVTAVDLSLSMVILFLLGAITVRAFIFVDERSGLNLFGHLRRRR
ncbi:MAG TPA: hypothetical protein VII06_39640 [Chloroflexota bacterium]|jgi:hypothetical protein